MADAGVLFNISGVVTAALMIPMGRLSDKLGRKKMVVVGLAVYGCSLAAIAFAHSYRMLMAPMVIGAVGQAASRPSMDALVTEASSLAERERMMGVYDTCEDMSGILGPLLGGLAWKLGGAVATFVSCGPLVVLGSIIALAAVEEKNKQGMVLWRQWDSGFCGIAIAKPDLWLYIMLAQAQKLFA